ncbi:hypothetical protein GCM10025870_28570 [Agromyces marinus]|uniref:DUF4349 domain-containing protein n=1 Tax=Agromyces marinus TaxID=1389020 RepID=A0ABM8H4P9_9MICO|nr:DUF4349 domain-containing protein [Agromyces marinus]BDZ55784.1 hypothetical protein GCM10025870_28570 [Agromyces marinus]
MQHGVAVRIRLRRRPGPPARDRRPGRSRSPRPRGGRGRRRRAVAPRDQQPFTEGEELVRPDQDRSVITTGWVSITVDDPIASAAEVSAIVERAGGRIDSRSEVPGTPSQQAQATLVVRVPSGEVDAVIDGLRKLGDVDSIELDATDVTQQRQDLDARIESLQTSVDRLRTLLAQADDVSDLIAIESELTTRQSELDSLTTWRDSLVDQVDYSTITVGLLSEGIVAEPRPDDFWGGIAVGWTALVGFVQGLLVAIGVLLPWIGLLLVLGAIVVGIVVLATRGRRRADAAAQPARGDAPPTPGEDPQRRPPA